MIFVWGKRTYGKVHRVGNVSIKTFQQDAALQALVFKRLQQPA